MFLKSLNKASFIFMVPFFIISFSNEINAQVKYVFHNKANLKLNRKYSIPRVAKRSIQTIKSSVIKSNSTNNIKISGVKIINNPTSIRNVSEKLYSYEFKKYMPPTIFSSRSSDIVNFIKQNKLFNIGSAIPTL